MLEITAQRMKRHVIGKRWHMGCPKVAVLFLHEAFFGGSILYRGSIWNQTHTGFAETQASPPGCLGYNPARWCSRNSSCSGVKREVEKTADHSAAFYAAPATVRRQAMCLAFINSPLGFQTPEKAMKVVSASPDTGQQRGVLHAHCVPFTVGEGGEGTRQLTFLNELNSFWWPLARPAGGHGGCLPCICTRKSCF